MASEAHVIGVRVDPVTYDDVVDRICRWAAAGESRYVCAANVSMLVEARADPQFHDILEQADVVTPDGMPLVWELRRSGHSQPARVYGPDLTLAVCERAARAGIPVGFIGGDTATLNSLVAALTRRFDGLQIVYAHSPPFRSATRHEAEAIMTAIIASGLQILFVGLGCPKQERWMAAHRGQLPAVMLGVGAAFDFLSGHKRQAPHWMQRRGLEWLFRLLAEPHRLAKRYAHDIPRYAAYVLAERWPIRRRRGVVVAVLGPDGCGKD
ncbi:MAG TPA: WecB/TagA/CpsF family glycosyltransferase, partial [Longimicrobiales bacterium]